MEPGGATDVRMMGARGNEAGERAAHEHRRHHRDIGKMRPAEVRVVQDNDIARRERGERHGRLDSGGHCAEVDRNVSCLRHEPALRVEDGA